ncbi:Aspartyl-tRNA(Asn) amidotransferase subunit A @ Glutamyl-tRNA(Gln) amidotransferase subunit A [hydrothermal vent metagenome]|uniref:Aspartyl-tRNA(Asn) amidotransferase subunit A @ Glutamyl-tRNA(Gln) amidotransferase subunit A n=1 Tax=hydrothermal vent metagenome TaxID=652676 RepID=A0A3B0W4A0_9ZZZZ
MYHSATKLTQSIQSANVTIVDTVKTCLDQINRHNPAINAIVTLDKENAMNTATKMDLQINQNKELPPLFGVPVSIKDSFETQGIRTTSSYPPLQHYIPNHDATVVNRLKKAGAIILGKTNLPQLAGDIQCWSPLFGQTNNPWNTNLTSGGSSGGSAAAIAMNFSFLDIGSDLAGSIRIPAAYCGVAGLKSTENRIPKTGHIPPLPKAERSVRHLLSLGVLARCVDDLRLGFNIISGPDGVDSETPPIPTSTIHFKRTQPLRVAWWDDFNGVPLCHRTKIGLNSTIQQLTEAGMKVERCFPKQFDFDAAWYAFGIIMGAEIGLGISPVKRFPLSLMSRFLPQSQPLARAFAAGLSFNWRQYNEALNIRDRLILQIEQFLENWDVWLCPVTPSVAFPHQKPGIFKTPPNILVDDFSMSYLEGTISMTTPFSLTGNPVITLPTGIVEGLPVGVQIIGKRWNDEELLNHSHIIELIINGFQSPPNCF